MHEDGYTDQEIADEVGAKSWRTIHEILIVMDKQKKRENRLDIPKVRALQKAGWTSEKIEQEFNYRFSRGQIEEAMI